MTKTPIFHRLRFLQVVLLAFFCVEGFGQQKISTSIPSKPEIIQRTQLVWTMPDGTPKVIVQRDSASNLVFLMDGKTYRRTTTNGQIAISSVETRDTLHVGKNLWTVEEGKKYTLLNGYSRVYVLTEGNRKKQNAILIGKIFSEGTNLVATVEYEKIDNPLLLVTMVSRMTMGLADHLKEDNTSFMFLFL